MKRHPKLLRCVTVLTLLFLLVNCSISNAELLASDAASGALQPEGWLEAEYLDSAGSSTVSLNSSTVSVAAPSSVSAAALSRNSI